MRDTRHDVFSGWKDIANYLGKGVRTVQRYERQLGLPIRRPAGKPSGSVIATKRELDAWVSASSMRDSYTIMRPLSLSPEIAMAIVKGMEHGVKLRIETTALRKELRMTLDMLHKTVSNLHARYTSETLESSSIHAFHSDRRKAQVIVLPVGDGNHGKVN